MKKSVFEKKFTLPELRRIVARPVVKQFICKPLVFKDSRKPYLCQVQECCDSVQWVTENKRGQNIGLCFSHGEDL